MKKLFLILLATSFIFISCKDESINEVQHPDKKIDLSTKRLSYFDIVSVANSIENSQLSSYILDDKNTLNKSDEEKIKQILSPIIENGKKLHTELINNLSGTDDWNNLSESERENIINMPETQKAQLALIFGNFSEFDDGLLKSSQYIPFEVFLTCLETIIGIKAFSELIATTRELYTVSQAIKILKIFGRRYLFGYAGVALAIYDFIKCVGTFVEVPEFPEDEIIY